MKPRRSACRHPARLHRGAVAAFVACGLAGSGLAAPGDLLWSFDAGAPVRSTTAIGPDGTIFFGSAGDSLGALHALDPALGLVKWHFATGPLIASPVIGPDGTIYITIWDSRPWDDDQLMRVHAIDPLTHRAKWTYPVPEDDRGFLSSPVLSDDGVLYVLSERGWLHALGADTGQELWQHSTDDRETSFSSPVVGADGTVYLATASSATALEPSTGHELWIYHADRSWDELGRVGGFHASPALGADGTVYLGSTSGFFFAFDGFSGGIKWWTKPGERITSSAAVGSDETIYFGSDDGRVYALDGATGEQQWSFQTGGTVHSSPTLAEDGTLYVGSYDHSVYALDAATGAKRWSFETGDKVLGSAALGPDGTVYIGSQDGRLYAIEGTASLANCPWPKFRGQADNRATAETSGAPGILAPAASAFVAAGSDVTLGALVGGERPMTFQWSLNGSGIEGADRARLELSNVTVDDAGIYRLTAKNDGGMAETTAELKVGYRLTLAQRTGGAITVDPDQDLYSPGTIVELAAAPEPGREFLGWLGDASSTANPLRLAVNDHLHMSGRFTTFDGEVIWERSSGWISTPAIGPDGTVYLGGETLRALNPVTGLPRWVFHGVSDSGFSTVMLSPEGVLFARADDHRIYAVEAITGQQVWSSDNSTASWPELALGPNGWVYARSGAVLDALNGETGLREWRVTLGNEGGWAPNVSADGTVLTDDGRQPRSLLALDGLTGATLWTFTPTEDWYGRHVIGSDGTIYLSGPNLMRALNGVSGAELWNVTLGEFSVEPPVIGPDGTLFTWNSSEGVFALDPGDGHLIWRALAQDEERWLTATPIVGADGVLYVRNSEGRLWALDTNTGAVRWRARFQSWNGGSVWLGPKPVLYTYVGWPVNELQAIQVPAGIATSPWPAFRGGAGNTALAYRPLRLLAPSWRNGEFSAQVDTARGVDYTLEFSDSPQPSDWSIGVTITGDGSRGSLQDATALTTKRIYRVRAEPSRGGTAFTPTD